MTSIPSAASPRDPCRSAIDAGERRGDEHADRHRRELEPGHDRRLRPAGPGSRRRTGTSARSGRGRSGTRAADAAAKSRSWKSVEVEHRRARRGARSATKSGSRTTAASEAADHERVVPAGEPALREREHEPGEPDDVRRRRRAGRARAPCCGPSAPRGRGRPRGSRSRPSGTLNQKTHCQRDRDERAAEHRADHEPDRGDHRVRAHREPELARGNASVTSAAAFANRNAPPMPCRIAPEDQLACPLAAKPAPSEASGEDEEAEDVGASCGRRGRRAGRP